MTYSKEFLEKTIKVWQPYSKEPLTLEDAREITENMTQFFRLLAEVDSGQRQREAVKNELRKGVDWWPFIR